MKEVEINGKQYSYKFTMSAGRDFLSKHGVTSTKADYENPNHLISIIYLGLKYGSKTKGIDFDLKEDAFDEYSYKEMLDLMISLTPDEDKKDPK
jgi:hypothetical protein